MSKNIEFTTTYNSSYQSEPSSEFVANAIDFFSSTYYEIVPFVMTHLNVIKVGNYDANEDDFTIHKMSEEIIQFLHDHLAIQAKDTVSFQKIYFVMCKLEMISMNLEAKQSNIIMDIPSYNERRSAFHKNPIFPEIQKIKEKFQNADHIEIFDLKFKVLNFPEYVRFIWKNHILHFQKKVSPLVSKDQCYTAVILKVTTISGENNLRIYDFLPEEQEHIVKACSLNATKQDKDYAIQIFEKRQKEQQFLEKKSDKEIILEENKDLKIQVVKWVQTRKVKKEKRIKFCPDFKSHKYATWFREYRKTKYFVDKSILDNLTTLKKVCENWAKNLAKRNKFGLSHHYKQRLEEYSNETKLSKEKKQELEKRNLSFKDCSISWQEKKELENINQCVLSKKWEIVKVEFNHCNEIVSISFFFYFDGGKIICVSINVPDGLLKTLFVVCKNEKIFHDEDIVLKNEQEKIENSIVVDLSFWDNYFNFR